MGWLLDHPDVQATEVSDAETVSDEYSDEEVLEEMEEAEPPFPAVSVETASKAFQHLPHESFCLNCLHLFFGDVSLPVLL